MAPPKQQAPWRAAFLDHLAHMDSPELTLATVAKLADGSLAPRARTCIYRGMWAELPPNDRNTAPKNPPAYESDLPTVTTDVRMDKIAHIFDSGPGDPTSPKTPVKAEDAHWRSGGGGPVEALWWVQSTNTQWRIKGRAYVVGPDIEDGAAEQASGARTVKAALTPRMRAVSDEAGWSWATELTAQFGNLSPGMRGSFKQPPPGQPKDEPYDKDHERLGDKVTSNDDPVARKHFRVVVIRPDEVERTLLDPENPHRVQYSWDSGTGTWSERETWP